MWLSIDHQKNVIKTPRNASEPGIKLTAGSIMPRKRSSGTLTHCYAGHSMQLKTSPAHLQELGGWVSFSMVQRYAHLSPGHLKQYAERTLLGEVRSTETGTLADDEKKGHASG
jgi:hypothetical protein